VKYFEPSAARPYTQFYGHQCVRLQAMLSINGFDELYDGSKGWNDCECGVRLSKLDYRFVHDENLELREHAHTDLPWGTLLDPDCCDGKYDKFFAWAHEAKSYRTLDPVTTWRANDYPWRQVELVIRRCNEQGEPVPEWARVYADDRLCFNLKNLWQERRANDGLH